MSGPRLHRFPVIDTCVPDEMRDALVNTFYAREFDARRNDETFRAVGNRVQFKHLDLTYCSYSTASTAVRLTFPASDLVRQQFPLSGGGQTGFGRSQFSVNANETCIVAAGADVSFDFKADFAQLILRIDADALQNMLNALVGWPVSRNIEFLAPL